MNPTPERHQHGRVTRDTKTVSDIDNRISLPWRVETLLARMERRGDIGARERAAGEEFARWFYLAHLDPLKAGDVHRDTNRGKPEFPHSSDQARRRVHAALDALGGIASPCGSAAWHILGCELTLRNWALRQGWAGRPILDPIAKGLLIGALGVLAQHFGL